MEEKKESNLKELTMEEKWNLLTIIYLSDIRQLRLISINSINLNFLFPTSSLDITIDKEISPLILACYIGKLEIITYLLTNEYIDINLQSKPENYSPLIISCYKGYYEIVRILLEMKADINLPNKNGQLPFIFCFSRLDQMSFRYENKKICMMLIDLLLSYGADINSIFDKIKGYTVIMKLLSCEIINEERFDIIFEIMKFLLQRGANVEIKGKDKLNIFDILKDNKKILPKYKEEFYFILENTKQLVFFNDKNFECNDLASNSNLSSLYQGKHVRNLSSLYTGIKSNHEILLQTDDSNGTNCCNIF